MRIIPSMCLPCFSPFIISSIMDEWSFCSPDCEARANPERTRKDTNTATLIVFINSSLENCKPQSLQIRRTEIEPTTGELVGERNQRFSMELKRRVETLPGSARETFSRSLPPGGANSIETSIEGAPSAKASAFLTESFERGELIAPAARRLLPVLKPHR